MSSSEDRAFLQAILAAPDDDGPRLVYADWLDEHGGHERAEFIRVQCALAAMREDDTDRKVLAWREQELLDAHRASWRATLPSLDGITWEDPRRGFIEGIRASSVGRFLNSAERIFDAAPIRELRLDQEIFPPHPHLTRFVFLTQSLWLARINCLILAYCRLGDRGLSSLCSSRNVENLRELYLAGDELGGGSGRGLAQSPFLRNLELLDLRDNMLQDFGVELLAADGSFRRLQTLTLTNNRFGDPGAIALATWAAPTLTHLHLNYNNIGTSGVGALAASPGLGGLVELDLRHNQVGNEAAMLLAQSPVLGKLQTLWLNGNAIGREAAAALRRRYGKSLRL